MSAQDDSLVSIGKSPDRSGPWIHLRVSLSKGVHVAPSQKLSKDLKKQHQLRRVWPKAS